jgi:autotransporter-associated beta strand protein
MKMAMGYRFKRAIKPCGAVTAAVAAAFTAAALAPRASATPVTNDTFDYTAGARLIGQTNPGTSKVWGDPPTPAQPAAGVDTQLIAAGNLAFPGLAAPTGNSFNVPNDIQSNIARIDFPSTQSVSTAPDGLFFSFTMKLTSFSSLPAGTAAGQAGSTVQQNGAFVAGYNWGSNAGANGMQTASAYGAQFRIRREVDANNAETGKYQLGIIKNNNPTSGVVLYAWDTTHSYSVGETLLITASYKFNGASSGAGSVDDESFLWVNGVPGNPQPATPTVTAPTGAGTTDKQASSLYNAKSFYFRSDTALPGVLQVDELRIGTSFQEVTPSAPVYYWDTNGTAGGSGGTAPSGNWDGSSSNFNSDVTGGGAGSITSSPTANDVVSFAAGADATGSYTVNVTGARSAAVANFNLGNVTLDGGTLAIGNFRVAAGTTATVSSVVTGFGVGNGAGSVAKTGPGTLTLSGANTHTGGTFVYEGTLVAGNADALAGGALSVSTGAAARFQAGLPKAATVSTVSLDGTGSLDITDNAMVIKGMTTLRVRALVNAGYTAGAWTGPGITSSTAAAGTSTGIGYADNSVLGLTSFKGVDVGPTDVLVKYTYYGDADLDGDVDGNDVGRWATNFTGSGGSTAKTWLEGDWDYDGDVDGNDVGRWAVNFTGSGGGTLSIPNAQPEAVAMLQAMGFTVVPEPASLGLLGAVAVGTLARRRRDRTAVWPV